MKATNLGLTIAGTLLLAACSREQPEGAPREPEPTTAAPAEKATAAEPADEAVAQIAPTQGNTVTGSLALASSPEGVHVTGAIQGLKPNAEFGFHVHEKGDCSAPDGSSAGGHFNPTQAQHGNPTSGAHHAGDMANIRSNAEGVAEVDTTASGTTLHGEPGHGRHGQGDRRAREPRRLHHPALRQLRQARRLRSYRSAEPAVIGRSCSSTRSFASAYFLRLSTVSRGASVSAAMARDPHPVRPHRDHLALFERQPSQRLVQSRVALPLVERLRRIGREAMRFRQRRTQIGRQRHAACSSELAPVLVDEVIAGERAQPGPEGNVGSRGERALASHVDHLEPGLLRDVFRDRPVTAQASQESQQRSPIAFEQPRERREVAVALEAKHQLGISSWARHTRDIVIRVRKPPAALSQRAAGAQLVDLLPGEAGFARMASVSSPARRGASGV